MQSSNQNDLQAKTDARLRVIRTLWSALFLSIGIYYVLTLFTGHPNVVPNRTVSIALAAAGSFFAIISIPIKQKYLTQSVTEQRVELVQTGYIIAWALTEVAALLGLLDHFIAGNRYYYVLFVIAAGGMLLNSPRRQHVLDACFKSASF
ncbi:MAG TPA: hypothetical protein VN920_06180 [Pyrinomonadaceae bacterium]|nr:hypothetical protein [Pyrinomonadaceae bacterium]